MNGAVQRPSVGPRGAAGVGRLRPVRLRGAVRAQREGIGGQPARCRVAAHRVDLRADRVDRPAAEAAAGGRDEPHVAQPARAVGGRALVQQEDGQVRRDRVVAAGVHDPRAGLPGERRRRGRSPRGRTAPRRSGPRSASRPGRTPRPAAARTWRTGPTVVTTTRVAAARAASDAGSVASASSERPVASRAGQPCADRRQLLPRPPGERDPGARRRVRGQVRGRQRPDEPGGAVHDEVEVPRGRPAPPHPGPPPSPAPRLPRPPGTAAA